MEFIEAVEQLANRIKELKDTVVTEEATKNAFIMPFIGQVLGYDVFNPNEVVPEFTADVGVKRGEKVDYALMSDAQVQMLIECKKIGSPLSLENASQLYRYFAVTNARIGVLTNGQVWNFYMDIDEPNRMDSKPFLILDMLNIDTTVLPSLEKLTKPAFDLDSIANSAEELKYVGALKRAVADEFKTPSDDFVKLLASHVHEGAFYASVMEKFRPLADKALRQFLSEQVNDRLKTALGADSLQVDLSIITDEDEEDIDTDNGIVTTDDEIAAYRIIKAIACSEVEADRVTMRDAKVYCAVFLDDNNRRPIARLYFNGKQKFIGLFDEDKSVERFPVENLNSIYNYTEEIRQTVKRYL